MARPSRLSLVLAQLLGPLPLGGYGGPDDTPAIDDDTVPGHELDSPWSSPSGPELADGRFWQRLAAGARLSTEDLVATGFLGSPGEVGPAALCCYQAPYLTRDEPDQCFLGRPLMVEGRAVSARSAERSDWAVSLRPDVSHLSRGVRRILADAWTRAALLEHASVPAFGRVVLDLIALGAPADLVDRAAASLRDEIAHAEGCFALASAYAGREVGPGPLPVPPTRRPSLRKLAMETFREGCVGETLSVGLAAAQLRRARDPAVRAVLMRIVQDESRHAELAWDIVRWAIDAGGSSVRWAVARAARTLPRPTSVAPRVAIASHGVPEAAVVDAALRLVMDRVVTPAAAELFAAA